MGPGATKWIWENSRASNGSLIVLLAIADEIGEGEFTEMKIADLAVKCRLSDKGARNAVKDLVALGELSLEGGRGAVARFALCQTSVKTTDVHRQNLPTSASASVKITDPQRRQKLPTSPEEPQVNGTSVKITDPQISDERSTTGLPVVEKPSSERPDVDRLCTHLADRIVANGSRRPNITKRWKDAARLLIDNDGRTEKQVHNMIDWCQDSEFWRSNIMSMPKLREKYDALKMKAMAGTKPPSGRSDPDDDYAAALQRIRARKENVNGHRGNGHDSQARQVSLPAAADRQGHLRNVASRHRPPGLRRRPGRRHRHRPLGEVLLGGRHHRRSRPCPEAQLAPVRPHRR